MIVSAPKASILSFASIAVVIGSITLGGCATLNDRCYENTQRLRAVAAFKDCGSKACTNYPHDYRKGWIDGFYEVATGGPNCPPAIAPQRYWDPKTILKDCDNRRHAYYSGWQDGASRASQFPDTHYLRTFETCNCPLPRCTQAALGGRKTCEACPPFAGVLFDNGVIESNYYAPGQAYPDEMLESIRGDEPMDPGANESRDDLPAPKDDVESLPEAKPGPESVTSEPQVEEPKQETTEPAPPAPVVPAPKPQPEPEPVPSPSDLLRDDLPLPATEPAEPTDVSATEPGKPVESLASTASTQDVVEESAIEQPVAPVVDSPGPTVAEAIQTKQEVTACKEDVGTTIEVEESAVETKDGPQSVQEATSEVDVKVETFSEADEIHDAAIVKPVTEAEPLKLTDAPTAEPAVTADSEEFAKPPTFTQAEVDPVLDLEPIEGRSFKALKNRFDQSVRQTPASVQVQVADAIKIKTTGPVVTGVADDLKIPVQTGKATP